MERRLVLRQEWGKDFLTELRVEMLKRNGIEAALAARYPDQGAREAAIRHQAADWARLWDADSLVILRRARSAMTR